MHLVRSSLVFLSLWFARSWAATQLASLERAPPRVTVAVMLAVGQRWKWGLMFRFWRRLSQVTVQKWRPSSELLVVANKCKLDHSCGRKSWKPNKKCNRAITVSITSSAALPVTFKRWCRASCLISIWFHEIWVPKAVRLFNVSKVGPTKAARLLGLYQEKRCTNYVFWTREPLDLSIKIIIEYKFYAWTTTTSRIVLCFPNMEHEPRTMKTILIT